MICCNRLAALKQPKKNVTLTFKRKELLYDISNIAFVEGDIVPEGEEHGRHQIIDICQDGNVDRVTRVMDLVVAHCREMLYPFTKIEIEDESDIDDTFKESEYYYIELSVPADFSKTTFVYLERLIHNYIVYKVLADWLSITNTKNPRSGVNWYEKATDLESEIESALSARMHRVRRTQTPF